MCVYIYLIIFFPHAFQLGESLDNQNIYTTDVSAWTHWKHINFIAFFFFSSLVQIVTHLFF